MQTSVNQQQATPSRAAPLAAQYAANQALLDSIRRLSPGQHLVGDQVCVIYATFGVDTLAAGIAPGSELVRVYVNTDNPHAFSLQTFAAYLGIAQPLIKSAMEFVTVLKHSPQPLEILPLVPSHADGLNLLIHATSSCGDSEIVTVTDTKAAA